MINLRSTLIIIALLNLIIASIISPEIIDPFIIFITFNTIILIAELVKIYPLKTSAAAKLIQLFFVLTKLLFLTGFYILLTNVFVLKYGRKSCDHCVTADTWWILTGALYLFFYLIFMCVTFTDVFNKPTQ